MSSVAASPASSAGLAAIECRGLSKTYQLGESLSLQKSFTGLFQRGRDASDDFYALREVSFSVPRGEYFGIVGANGSGKSTLTEIISGITVPTGGDVVVWGRVLPLLEVGAGFHSELTGRENVVLLGTVIGLGRAHIHEEMPRIAQFAGVERHLDTPLKFYSSGMQARLSFATAMCFPADVYIFDEVLAVVDDAFREMCIRAMADLHADGRTIVFMSHDLSLVESLCSAGMWLDRGRVCMTGQMADVSRAYAANTAT